MNISYLWIITWPVTINVPRDVGIKGRCVHPVKVMSQLPPAINIPNVVILFVSQNKKEPRSSVEVHTVR